MPQIITGQQSLTNMPIGAVVAWLKNLAGVPVLGGDFAECNGQVLVDTESPLNGETLPDLNTTELFLGGAATSGGIGGAATHTHTVSPPHREDNMEQIVGGIDDIWYGSGEGTTNNGDNIPPYYGVVWVMRIK